MSLPKGQPSVGAGLVPAQGATIGRGRACPCPNRLPGYGHSRGGYSYPACGHPLHSSQPSQRPPGSPTLPAHLKVRPRASPRRGPSSHRLNGYLLGGGPEEGLGLSCFEFAGLTNARDAWYDIAVTGNARESSGSAAIQESVGALSRQVFLPLFFRLYVLRSGRHLRGCRCS